MNTEEYMAYDATGLAELVRAGEVTASELLDCALARIDAVNPVVNAVATRAEDLARAEVRDGLPDGPFTGVPFLIKEFGAHARGLPCRMGTRLAGDLVFDYDTELMRRFRAAGLVTVGTTTTPEMAFNANSEALLYGSTRNPWNTAHSAGGSSGGAGAAVAAGMVPMAHANDGGGSIRIPAAVNGLVGLKPTRGRTPGGPDFGMLLYGLAIEFAVSRSLRDSAALLDAVQGPDAGCFYSAPSMEGSFLAALNRPPGRLRIGWLDTVPGAAPLDTEIADRLADCCRQLEGLGHEVRPVRFEYEAEVFNAATLTLWATTLGTLVEQLAEQTGQPVDETTTEAVTREVYAMSQNLKATDVEKAMAVQNQVSRHIGAALDQFDVLLTPGLLTDPAPLGHLDQNAHGMSVPDWWNHIIRDYSSFTPPFNTSGHPAMMLPLYQSRAGLPMGMQFIGGWGREDLLFSLAAQLEQLLPWAGRRAAL